MSMLMAGLALGLLAAGSPVVPMPVSGPGRGLTPGPHSRRGPLDSRDEFLLAQPRLTLPAVSPDVLARGETRWRVAADWGNDFGYRQRREGDLRRTLYFVDGEHRSAAVSVSRGLSDRFTAGARLPLLWRGGGVLDGVIDSWHRLTGLPDSNRPQFPRDELHVRALDHELQPLAWSGDAGSALGNLELSGRWSLEGTPVASGWSGALVGRLQFPTATGSFRGGGLQAGGQVVAAHSLGRAADVYLGLGATVGSSRRQQGLEYARARPGGFAALEWRPGRAVSLLAEANAAGRLIRGVEAFPGLHLTLKMGARIDVGRGWRLEGGFCEGLKEISTTTDFGVMVGVERSIRPRRR